MNQVILGIFETWDEEMDTGAKTSQIAENIPGLAAFPQNEPHSGKVGGLEIEAVQPKIKDSLD